MCPRSVESASAVAGPGDLDAVREMWSGPDVLGTGGAFVLLTYLALPGLVAVRPPGGRPRAAFDGMAERTFLLRLLGLTTEPEWGGGVGNREVRRLAATLGREHRAFAGMRQDHMELIAALVALAPLLVRRAWGRPVGGGELRSYWRYMTCATALMETRLEGWPAAEQRCRAFCAEHAGRSAAARRLLAQFAGRHPGYVAAAVPLLFPEPRAVVRAALGDADD
ncbi:hypothetical protein [Actinacidiphila acididurans]|uniref:ER-bound oxygenase mpaB/mpaB'/Rubber oxygenase catalytic domain-containing protein n=1 Tax=Actinacidiphila acididurans TaxID=2784346 RepID=A0ABS2TLW4_9ACTN|nr:hypothetical protein [Actinacidiphila acididurans]MBM9504325.1 hypothetical protein [Actinacidiphila acididurans]